MLSNRIVLDPGKSGACDQRAASLRNEMGFLCSRVVNRMELTGPDPMRIGICATFPGEGTTTVAANLAISLSRQGKNVVLVEANQQRPSLAAHFDLPASPGLGQLRKGEATIQEARQEVGQNFSVITIGEASNGARNGGEELTVLEALGEPGEVLVFDLPPLSRATDTADIMRGLDAMILVVRANRTRKIDYLRSVKTLRQLGVFLVGTVLNDLQYDIPPVLARMF